MLVGIGRIREPTQDEEIVETVARGTRGQRGVEHRRVQLGHFLPAPTHADEVDQRAESDERMSSGSIRENARASGSAKCAERANGQRIVGVSVAASVTNPRLLKLVR